MQLQEKNQKLSKEEALKILAYRRKYERYRTFTPNGRSQEFVEMIGKNETFISFFSAANGVGKTATGCNIVANLCYPTDNPYFKDLPLFNKWPYLKRGRIVSDHTTIKQKIIPELQLWFPEGRYTCNKGSRDFESVFRTDTGWHIDLMTYDQQPKEFESVDLGFFWCDEPPPELIYKALISRLRRGGIGFITATPLTGSAWMYDALVTKSVAGQRGVVFADVEENCRQHGTRGILEHGDIMRMIAEYSEEDKQARVFGKFQHLIGLVFKEFNKQIHVIPPFTINDKDFSTIELLDCHPRNADALMWVATRSDGIKFVIDELYDKFDSFDTLAARIKKTAVQYRIVERFADPSAWADVQPNKTMAQGLWEHTGKQLEDRGLEYQPASKKRTEGIKLIRNALSYQITEVNGAKQFVKPPMLYVFDNCVRTIWEFEHWQWNEWTGKSSETKDKSEKPQDKDDHMMENLGRSFLNDPGFVPLIIPTVQQTRPISLDPYPTGTQQVSMGDPYS